MARGTRNPGDSITSRTTAFQVINNPIVPSPTLPEVSMTYFNQIVSCRERSTWNQMDIHLATQLAVTMQNIDEIYKEIEDFGWHYKHKGKLYRHPAALQLKDLVAMELSLLRQLGLSASLRGVSGKAQAKRNVYDSEARSVGDRADDSDGLLA